MEYLFSITDHCACPWTERKDQIKKEKIPSNDRSPTVRIDYYRHCTGQPYKKQTIACINCDLDIFVPVVFWDEGLETDVLYPVPEDEWHRVEALQFQ